MYRIGALMTLPQLTLDIVRRDFPKQADAQNLWFNQLQAAFNAMNFNDKWSTFVSQIDNNGMNMLNMAAMLLETQTDSGEVPSEVVEALRGRLVELEKAVKEA